MKNFYKTCAITLMLLFFSSRNCVGAIVASGDLDGKIRIWDTETRHCNAELEVGEAEHAVVSLAFSSNGKELASLFRDGKIKIWKTESGVWDDAAPVFEQVAFNEEVSSGAFNYDLTKLAVGLSWDIKIIDIKKGGSVEELRAGSGEIHVSLSRDWKIMASSSEDGPLIKIWNVEEGVCVKNLEEGFRVQEVILSLDGKRLASVGDYGEVKIRDVKTGDCIVELAREGSFVGSPDFNQDGTKLVVPSGYSKKVEVWDVETGKLVKKLEGHKKEVFIAVFNSDGTRLASGDGDGVIKVWKTVDGTWGDAKLFATLTGHARGISAVAFSPVDDSETEIRKEAEQERIKFLLERMEGIPGKSIITTPGARKPVAVPRFLK